MITVWDLSFLGWKGLPLEPGLALEEMGSYRKRLALAPPAPRQQFPGQHPFAAKTRPWEDADFLGFPAWPHNNPNNCFAPTSLEGGLVAFPVSNFGIRFPYRGVCFQGRVGFLFSVLPKNPMYPPSLCVSWNHNTPLPCVFLC